MSHQHVHTDTRLSFPKTSLGGSVFGGVHQNCLPCAPAHPRLAASQPTRPPPQTRLLDWYTVNPANHFQKLSLRGPVFDRVHHDPPPLCIRLSPLPGISIHVSTTPRRPPQQVHIVPRRSFLKTEPPRLSFRLGAPELSSLARLLIPTLQHFTRACSAGTRRGKLTSNPYSDSQRTGSPMSFGS